jgi:membrane fusion protein (multidrug efflux system)
VPALRAPSLFVWLSLAALVLAACGRQDDAPEAPAGSVEVGVVTIHAQPVVLTTELPGRMTAYRFAEVRPQVNGVILERLFVEGDEVKQGQQLYQIDPGPYQAVLDSANAAIQKSKAAETAAQLTMNRDRPLAKAFAISKQELDNATSTLLQAQADVAASVAAAETAKINLAYTKVYAPISGHTSRSSVTEGALVTADQTTALVTITQLNPIYVDVTQPATTLLRLKRELAAGQLKSAGKNQAEVHLVLPETGGEYPHPGRLQFSEVNVDENTGSVTIRAIFPNDEGLLLPGMFVRERIQEGIAPNALLVPQRGVTHNQRGQPTALVVGKDNKVELRILTADRAIGTNWLVTAGIAEGDRVIVDGVQKVRPGEIVKPQEFLADARPTGN